MMASNLPLRFNKPLDDADQVAANRAADAAIVHLEDFFVGADDKVIVDADGAELIDDDSEFPAVILRQDAVQKRRLAGAEIAGEDGDGDFFGHAGLRRGLALGARRPNIGDPRADANLDAVQRGSNRREPAPVSWRALRSTA